MKRLIIAIYLPFLMSSCFILKDISVDIDRFLNGKPYSTAIYSTETKGLIYSPFQMNIDVAEKLILFDFKDNDRYKFLEFQYYNDDFYGNGVVCMLMKHDGRLEIYHSPNLNMKQQLYYFDSIQRTIPTYMFEPDYEYSYENGYINFNLSFSDKYSNKINASLSGFYPIFQDFIVPVGYINRNSKYYTALPIFYMRKLNFLNTTEGHASIFINDTICPIKKVPGLFNWKRIYFARWSLEPIFILWNTNGQKKIEGVKKENFKNDSLEFNLNTNSDHVEIKNIRYNKHSHSSEIEFSPCLPEILCLREGTEISGKFTINIDEKKGVIGGTYYLVKQGNKTTLIVKPTKCYQPIPGKTWVKKFNLLINISTDNNEFNIISKWVSV